MKTLLTLPLVALLLFLGAAPIACSSKSGCDDSKCAAGNKCVNTGTSTQCELLCAKQTDCPANYHCDPAKGGSTNYCQPDGVKYTSKPTGQWGSPCDPTKGLDNNSDCDTDQQFWCYGRTPTDAQSFCTQFQCNTDSDCGEDYVCATVNTFPNVQTSTRQFGQTTTVCLPRTYCQPCTYDIDCIGSGGAQAACVAGTDGAKFCTFACQNDGNCAQDATCDSNSGNCLPRAGVCKGDGSLCSPCRSDLDCPNGICAEQEYSHEHYCTVKSSSPCTVSNVACTKQDDYCTSVGEDSSGVIYGCNASHATTCDPKNNVPHFGCPASSPATPDISCTIDAQDPAIPQDNCYGLITFGTGANAGTLDGCWTKSN